MNLNNQNALYKHGMTPVFRLSGNASWARLKQKVTFEVWTHVPNVPLGARLRDGAPCQPKRARPFLCKPVLIASK